MHSKLLLSVGVASIAMTAALVSAPVSAHTNGQDTPKPAIHNQKQPDTKKDCDKPKSTPTPTPTPKPSKSPTPTPKPSTKPSVSPTPTPTPAGKGEVKGAATELPETGAEAGLSMLVGLPTLGLVGRAYLRSRR
jgi:outer membrane biosynthesis protein TonB